MKQKIKVYLKHGHTITFKCDSFVATLDNAEGAYIAWNAKGIHPDKRFSFLPSEMVAWERLR